jgi:TPR repeat protein
LFQESFGILKHYRPFRCNKARVLFLALSLTSSPGLTNSIASAQGLPTTSRDVSEQEAFKKGAEAYSKNDFSTALKWFRFAAARGAANASFVIGLMYRDGDGVGKDQAVAMQSFQAAAEGGYVRAQTAIGRQYALGIGVPQDNSRAMSWYLKAADQGDMEAQARLAVMYTFGTGVRTDLATALRWYLKAIDPANEAKQDLPLPIIKQMKAAYEFAIGTIYEDGGDGVPRNPATAKEWYRKASEHGNTDAKTRLAMLAAPQPSLVETKTLLCEFPSGNRSTEKYIVYIDTNSKFVKIDTLDQGILEYKDGLYGKIIKTGFRRADAADVHQFVIVEQERVRFGIKNNVNSESMIDLRTGVFTSIGLLNRTGYCSARSTR